MVRALTAAVLAILLLPGVSWAQEAEKTPEAGPAVTEPEQQSAEVAPPQAGPKAGGQEAVYESYTVKSGDTLWDLSSRFLGNPWYWPKVWSYNPEIENPHWIYPGNQIRFYPGGDEAPAMVEGEGVKAPAEMADVTQGSLTPTAPEQFGEDEDPVAIAGGNLIGYKTPQRALMRQDGLVTQRELDDAGVIENAYTTKEMLDNYERVYLKFRNQSAVRIGERYSIFRTIDTVSHPITGANYGYLTKITGTLRVIATDKHYVTGLIDQTFEPVERGDFVGPLGNFDKQILRKENTREVKGYILLSLNRHIPYVGEQHWVFLDKGGKDGVEEGNSFVVYKRGDPLLEDTDPSKLPAEVAGLLLVVDVKEHTSEALILRSLVELEEGDRVVMKPASGQVAAQ